MSAASVYLDHNATSPLRPAAFDAMVEALKAGGNPSSVHKSGRAARARIDAARRQVAALVGTLPAEIVFTSGGTEANNLALKGAGRRRVLASAVEHDSVLKAGPCEIIPVDRNGVVDLAALERMLAGSKEPALVSVMFANNETGVLQPIAEVVRLARKAGALVHCDAVQAAGKAAVDMHGLGVDYLSLSAHKLGGPTGVGALAVRAGAPFETDRRGGGQESNRRAGTENVAGIAGFGAAAEAAGNGLDVAKLRDRLEAELRQDRAASRGLWRIGSATAQHDLHLHAGSKGGDAGHGARSCRRLRERRCRLFVGQGQPLGGADGHGSRTFRSRDRAENQFRLEYGFGGH